MNIIRDRRSVRKYKEEMVDRETLKKIIEDSSFAPSWANTQVARYNVIESPELIKDIRINGVNDFVYNVKVLENAKQVMVLSTKQGKSGRAPEGDFATNKAGDWEVFDGGIACQTFCLSAHAHGVGTVIMGVINDQAIKEIINLPEDETVAALVVFGYPAETPNTPPRMTVEEISRFL